MPTIAITEAQWCGLAFLVAFGLVYNKVVERQQTAGRTPFTALFVILGVLITLGVLFFDSENGVYDATAWITLTLAHFAASGLGMTIGSWRRAG